MKNKLIILLTLAVIASFAAIGYCADTNVALKTGMQNYKQANYIGCLQQMDSVLKNDPGNALAHYYTAISYVKLGKSSEASAAYDKVIKLSTNITLTANAKLGKTCLTAKGLCGSDTSSDFDRQLKEMQTGNGYGSDSANKAIKQIELNVKKNTINADVNAGKNDNKSENTVDEKIAMNDNYYAANPAQNLSDMSDVEIANAVRVLAKMGFNPLQQNMNPYTAYQQNPEYAQMSMLMGTNPSQNSSNNFFNMMPYILSQSAQQKQSINPEVIKTMMMSSMMGNMDFSAPRDY